MASPANSGISGTTDFDALILGSGQAGNPLADTFAAAGRRTALIERKDVGGTCVNTGCTPTKTMVASARVAYLARRGMEYGISVGGVVAELGRVRERKRAIVNKFRQGSEKNLEKSGVELIRGEASFTGPHGIHVKLRDGSERRVSAPLIVIDTGTRSFEPPIPGLRDVPYLNNESIMELDHLPEHLLVLGGGYIGMEFSQMFRRFGSKVTVIQSGSQLLSREDNDIAEEVRKILCEDGIDVMLNAHAERADAGSHGVSLEVRVGERVRTVQGSALLVGVGRVPNTASLNLAAAGVEVDDRGFIRVNDRLETSAGGIYAVGDVKGGPQFTHIAFDDYRILKSNLLGGGGRTVGDRMVPYTVFLDPQLGRIGMTEKEAHAAGIKVRVASMPMTSVARALEVGETRGMMKALVDAGTEKIVGAAVLGYEGGELMAVFQVAMMGGLKYPVLRDAVFAHPTMTESLNNLFSRFRNPT